MKKENKENKRTVPIVPLDDVLACMTDKDEFIRMAGRTYYNQYYLNRLQNDRPSK